MDSEEIDDDRKEEDREVGGTGVRKRRCLSVRRNRPDEKVFDADTSFDSPPFTVWEDHSRLKLSSTLTHHEVVSTAVYIHVRKLVIYMLPVQF